MAATRRNAMLIEEARQKISTTQLIRRLEKHALGTLELAPTQVRAIEILLRKVIPDLAMTEIIGEIQHNVFRVPAVAESSEAWERERKQLQ